MPSSASKHLPVALVSMYLAFAANNALALPVGDIYLIEGLNFPIDFQPVSANFNNVGDSTAEDLENAGILAVVEQALVDPGPQGGDVLQFQFSFLSFSPFDDNSRLSVFGFELSDLNFATGTQQLLAAYLDVDFGVSALPTTDVSNFTAANNADPFSVQFVSPLSWADLFALTSPPTGANPEQVVVNFFVETAAVPEPAILPLFGLGLLAWAATRRRTAQIPIC